MPYRQEDGTMPIHGGELDTSLLLYLNADLVTLEEAQDFLPSRRRLRGYRQAVGTIPAESPGSLSWPTRASVEKGRAFYQVIYERIAVRVFGCDPTVGSETG